MSDRYGVIQASLFDRAGSKLDELPGVAFNCTWSANEAGPAEMVLSSRYDTRSRRSLIKFAHIVEFNHARLGRWGGIISSEEGLDWNGSGEMLIKLRSGFVQFSRRRTPLYNYEDSSLYLNADAPNALRRLIAWANVEEDTRLRAYDVDNVQYHVTVKLQEVMMNEALATMLSKKRKSMLAWTEGGRDNSNHFVFNVFLYPGTGLRYTGYVLKEDINLETPTGMFARYAGSNLANDVLATNMGEQDGGLLREISKDQASIAENGLYQGREQVSTDSHDTVKSVADKALTLRSWPQYQLLLTAVETTESPDTFAHLRVGKIVRVQLHSVGFHWGPTRGVDTRVVIKSIEYSSIENKAMLTVETLDPV